MQADYHPAKSGEIKVSVADMRKAAAQLGFKSKISLEEGLLLTLKERACVCREVEWW